MEEFCCPYDTRYCEEFLKSLAQFQQNLEKASAENSSKLFLDEGDAFWKYCPKGDPEQHLCSRYVTYKKNQQNVKSR